MKRIFLVLAFPLVAGGVTGSSSSVMSKESRGYFLIIERTIEDLAGNNVGKPFDVDLFEGIDRKMVTGSVKIAVNLK